MKPNRILPGLLVCLTLLSACAQTAPAAQPDTSATEHSQQIQTEEDYHLRDKNLIYQQQDNTEVVTMYLTVSRGNSAEGTDHSWDEINTYSVYDYEEMGVERYKVAGLLQVGDENGLVPGELGFGQISPNCTVQIRGQSSSRNAQKNYKISIKDNKGDWRGQQTIALNKHQGDGVRFRNKMGFDLLTEIDELFSLRTTFVHLYVKDTTQSENAKFVDYGLYTQVEQLNRTALERHGLDKRGHLYKINVCEFYRYEDVIMLKDDPNYDVAKFEEILEIKGDDDHSKLISLLDVINDYSVPIDEILAKYFDVENIAYWMAFNILTGNIDTQSRNFYLYSGLNSERWYILPWDLDGMLRDEELTIQRRSDYSEWESGVSNYWGNVLFARALRSDSFRAALTAAVEDLYPLLTQRVQGYVQLYSPLVKPYVYSGADLRYAPLTAGQYDRVASSFSGEIETNYQQYYASYEKPMPFYIGTPTATQTGYSVEWEAAYDFDGEDITYTFELAKDYNFTNPILKLEGLNIPIAQFDKLPDGQYFIRVKAYNEQGQSQYAFDYYLGSAGKVYGVKSFYVSRGTIAEETYVEE